MPQPRRDSTGYFQEYGDRDLLLRESGKVEDPWARGHPWWWRPVSGEWDFRVRFSAESRKQSGWTFRRERLSPSGGTWSSRVLPPTRTRACGTGPPAEDLFRWFSPFLGERDPTPSTPVRTGRSRPWAGQEGSWGTVVPFRYSGATFCLSLHFSGARWFRFSAVWSGPD